MFVSIKPSGPYRRLQIVADRRRGTAHRAVRARHPKNCNTLEFVQELRHSESSRL